MCLRSHRRGSRTVPTPAFASSLWTRTSQPNTERKRPDGAVELIPRDVVGHDIVYYLPFVEGRMSVPLDRMVAEMNTKDRYGSRTMEEK